MNYSELLQLAKGWGNFISDRIIIWRLLLLKETSVFSAISLMDLMFTAKDLIGQYYNTTECLVMLVGFYIIMLLPVSVLGTLVEHKARYRMFGD